ARAVAPLDRLAGLAVPLVRPGGLILAVKGERAVEETEAAGPVLRRLGISEVSVVQAGTVWAGSSRADSGQGDNSQDDNSWHCPATTVVRMVMGTKPAQGRRSGPASSRRRGGTVRTRR
ncbi:MAG: hypothetical protein ACRDNF_16765, partial [Streptosporangiaceae bacterium]